MPDEAPGLYRRLSHTDWLSQTLLMSVSKVGCVALPVGRSATRKGRKTAQRRQELTVLLHNCASGS